MKAYNEKVLEHFRNPKHMGEMKNPSASGEEGNPACGDRLRVYLKVENNRITDCKFLTYGCPVAVSVSDILCELAIGKTIDEAKKITNKVILEELGEIPKIKYHCSVLGMQALQAAIKDYESKSK